MCSMYLFTRGDGPLRTTHDLFTQAEFFAEEANKMYKTVREFSYEVPGSAEKSDLHQILEKIPVHCQALQVLVKSPTVGKSATFNKVTLTLVHNCPATLLPFQVDSVIQETKNLMNEISKLVTSCFVCATKVPHSPRSRTSDPNNAINCQFEIEFHGASMSGGFQMANGTRFHLLSRIECCRLHCSLHVVFWLANERDQWRRGLGSRQGRSLLLLPGPPTEAR